MTAKSADGARAEGIGAPPTTANGAATGDRRAGGGEGRAETLSPGATLPLPAAEVHLWSARPAAFTDPAQLARLRALLSGDELARADRFRSALDRRTGLVTRALVRITLSRYCGVPPARWRFRTNRHGRPEIAAPVSPLRFSVSHTDGLVVCLVGRSRRIGVDAESLGRGRRWLDLAERFFVPAEARALRQLPPARRPLRFLEYWTLKESYVKARGHGLTLPLSGFWFDLPAAPRDGIRIRFTPAVDDDPARWRFTLHRPGESHVVATATDCGRRDGVRIAHYEAAARESADPADPVPAGGRLVLDHFAGPESAT